MPLFLEMAFRGEWRDYQREVLDGLDGHLDDSRLHVVAAPGSGKTILGLEVLRRIGRPTIILAPTITIRDQWIDRLCGLFLDNCANAPAWVSASLAAPQSLTVITYQALDAALRASEAHSAAETSGGTAPFDEFVHYFEAVGATTLVLDEAHHLRQEWWRALMRLKEALAEVQIVALTATPPYDVDPAEWRRYEALCGSIDAEISIPALVRNGDLCPHQDLIHVSQPSSSELELMQAQRDQLTQVALGLQHDDQFLNALATHPWLVDPEKHVEEILDTPELQAAMLIFLSSAGRKPPKADFRVLGVSSAELPPLTSDIFEVLLNGVLYLRPDDFALEPSWRKTLQTELSRANAIEGRRVRIVEALQHYKILAGSLAKIGSIVKIARAETSSLGGSLRLVVLADFVRAADLDRTDKESNPARKLGVVPIFEALRQERIKGVQLAVLSGPLVIVPASKKAALIDLIRQYGHGSVEFQPLKDDADFLIAHFDGDGLAVRAITALFESGELNLLVGTAALLGEGWDAPPLNSLVLASYVGSYMLSNQMRGRAIRTDASHPEKAANIWHLATVSPTSCASFLEPLRNLLGDTADFEPEALGADMAMLARLFQGFEGLTVLPAEQITNGIDRLGMAGRSWTQDGIHQLNLEMSSRAAERGSLQERWNAALETGSDHPRMHQTAEVRHRPKIVTIDNTLEYLVISALGSGVFLAANALKGRVMPPDPAKVLMIIMGLVLFYSLPKLTKAVYLLTRNGTLEGSIGAVVRTVILSLEDAARLQTPSDQIDVQVTTTAQGKRQVQLLGASRRDEQLILTGLEEVLGPVRNPRYLLVSSSFFGGRRRMDYHPVPSTLGSNRVNAEAFVGRWNWRVGEAKLVPLRTMKGRLVLLRARARSFAAGFQEPFERYSVWQ